MSIGFQMPGMQAWVNEQALHATVLRVCADVPACNGTSRTGHTQHAVECAGPCGLHSTRPQLTPIEPHLTYHMKKPKEHSSMVTFISMTASEAARPYMIHDTCVTR